MFSPEEIQQRGCHGKAETDGRKMECENGGCHKPKDAWGPQKPKGIPFPQEHSLWTSPFRLLSQDYEENRVFWFKPPCYLLSSASLRQYNQTERGADLIMQFSTLLFCPQIFSNRSKIFCVLWSQNDVIGSAGIL